MVKETFEAQKPLDASFAPRVMLPLAAADSMDALAAGVSFAFLEISIVSVVLLIGTVTFLLSAAGLWIGSKFGEKYRAGAEITGGILLILMGVKVLMEGLGVF